MLREKEFTWGQLFAPKIIIMIWVPIVLITVLHYSTGSSHQWAHDVFRRLYYIPIILAAFFLGWRGSVISAIFISLAYIPHAFILFILQDPARGIEKILEIFLYNVIAIVTGVLADGEFHEGRRHEKTAEQLQVTLDEKNEMEKMLIRAGRLEAMGQLTAGLAHEINNPLASIMGAAEVVVEEISPDSPKNKIAKILLKEIKRLRDILDGFLLFAKPEKYDFRKINLCNQAKTVSRFLSSQAAKSKVKIITEPSSYIFVLGEPGKIHQVFMNLILNSIQAFTDGGEITLSCSRIEKRKKSYGLFSVKDNGPGIPDKIKERIFDPFYSSKSKGSGLGLAIAATIIDQHKGFIEVSDNPGGGARFDVFLPLAKDRS